MIALGEGTDYDDRFESIHWKPYDSRALAIRIPTHLRVISMIQVRKNGAVVGDSKQRGEIEEEEVAGWAHAEAGGKHS